MATGKPLVAQPKKCVSIDTITAGPFSSVPMEIENQKTSQKSGKLSVVFFIPSLKPGAQNQVRDSWLCHKSNILAQRPVFAMASPDKRKGAETSSSNEEPNEQSSSAGKP